MDKSSEKLNLLKDIQDIDHILSLYSQTGSIDREKVIAKIIELRITNKDIRKITMATIPLNPVLFSEASDHQLISELNVYRAILTENYLRNMREDTHADT